MNVALVDYGAGNLRSVERALRRAGATTARCARPSELSGADAIVLPGVGHFRALARGLDRQELRGVLANAIGAGVPFLGICLGMQALYETSDEAPEAAGLAVLAGRVRALPASVKLPHMGWNTAQATGSSRLLRGVQDEWFYFAHSFAAPAGGPGVVARCAYGPGFAAVVERGSVMGVQFHPEKSGSVGAAVLRNFLEAAS